MKFSIVVPIYNIEKYIKHCIESILSQSYENFELILVNDGSTDNSGKICDEYALNDDRIVVIHKENGGLVSARKSGVAIAKGDYLINIDGDDFIEENYLDKINNIIVKYNPDVVAVGCTWWSTSKKQLITNNLEDGIYENDDLFEIKKNVISDSCNQRISFGRLLYSSWSKISKLNLVRSIQNDIPNEITIGEDFAVTVQLLHKCKKLYVASYIKEYCYRKNENSMINTWKKSEYINELLLFKYMDTVLKKDDVIQMNKYIYLITLRYIIGAINKCENYKIFKQLLLCTIPINIFQRISCVKSKNLRDILMLKLLVKKKYWLIYVYYKYLRKRDDVE